MKPAPVVAHAIAASLSRVSTKCHVIARSASRDHLLESARILTHCGGGEAISPAVSKSEADGEVSVFVNAADEATAHKNEMSANLHGCTANQAAS